MVSTRKRDAQERQIETAIRSSSISWRVLPLDCVTVALSFLVLNFEVESGLLQTSSLPTTANDTTIYQQSNESEGGQQRRSSRKRKQEQQEPAAAGAAPKSRRVNENGASIQQSLSTRQIQTRLIQLFFGKRKNESSLSSLLWANCCFAELCSQQPISRIALDLIATIHGLQSIDLCVSRISSNLDARVLPKWTGEAATLRSLRIRCAAPCNVYIRFTLSAQAAESLQQWKSLENLSLRCVTVDRNAFGKLFQDGQRSFHSLELSTSIECHTNGLLTQQIDVQHFSMFCLHDPNSDRPAKCLAECVANTAQSLRLSGLTDFKVWSDSFLASGTKLTRLKSISIMDLDANSSFFTAMEKGCFPALICVALQSSTLSACLPSALEKQASIQGLECIELCIHSSMFDFVPEDVSRLYRSLALHPLRKLAISWNLCNISTNVLATEVLNEDNKMLLSLAPTLEELHVSSILGLHADVLALARQIQDHGAQRLSFLSVQCRLSGSMNKKRWYNDVIKAYKAIFERNPGFYMQVVDEDQSALLSVVLPSWIAIVPEPKFKISNIS